MDTVHPIILENQRVLAIVAHPDDETISCLGSLLSFIQAGSEVEVFVVNHGHQGRFTLCRTTLEQLGIKVSRPNLLTFRKNISNRRGLVSVLDKAIREYEPTIIISHGDHYGDHQEHSILSRLAGTAAFRYSIHAARDIEILSFEPTNGRGFKPNGFVNIQDSLKAKLAALGRQNKFDSKWYFTPQLAEKRARHWGHHYTTISGNKTEAAEAFEAFSIKLPQ